MGGWVAGWVGGRKEETDLHQDSGDNGSGISLQDRPPDPPTHQQEEQPTHPPNPTHPLNPPTHPPNPINPPTHPPTHPPTYIKTRETMAVASVSKIVPPSTNSSTVSMRRSRLSRRERRSMWPLYGRGGRVGGWVDRGEGGGLNEVLESLRVGGWVDIGGGLNVGGWVGHRWSA